MIGSLVSLFESKDVFIKEFQNVMGERLLKRDFDLDKEVSYSAMSSCARVSRLCLGTYS